MNPVKTILWCDSKPPISRRRVSRLDTEGGVVRVRTDIPIKVKGTTLDHSTGDLTRNPVPHITVSPFEAGKTASNGNLLYEVPVTRLKENWVEKVKEKNPNINFKEWVLGKRNLFSLREIAMLRKEGAFD